jgi:hypothetical protein
MHSIAAINFTPMMPPWAIAAVAALLAAALALGSRLLLRKRVPRGWVVTLAILRTIAIVVLVLCLLQPVVSYSRTAQRRPDLVVLLDTSRSMSLPADERGQTRLDAALQALRDRAVLPKLREDFDVHWFTFDRDTSPAEESELSNLRPTGDSTRIADSLATAVAFVRQGGGVTESPPRVLLVSDGNDLATHDADAIDVARRMGVSVDALVPPDSQPVSSDRAEVRIASVQTPQVVKLGSEMQVTATVSSGKSSSRTTAEVGLAEDGEVVARQPVEFAAGAAGEKVVRLLHRPARVGLHRYQLKLNGRPTASPFSFSCRVVDDAGQVLILEDTWRWEFKFLRRVLEDDPSFSFTTLLRRGRGSAMHVQFTEADRAGNGVAGFPQNGADLSAFDVIVVGDVDPRQWPQALAPAVARRVREDGKSLVVIAGPNLAALARTPAIEELLPVEVGSDSAVPREGPVSVRVTREASSPGSPFFANMDVAALPALDRVYPPLRKRPAATILLEAESLANSYGKVIVMAEHTVGRGRVLFIGTDALWNWQMTGPRDAKGVTPYTQFWQQALRAMWPAGGLHGSGETAVSVQPMRSRFEVGERVELIATSRSSTPLRATVTLPDQRELPLDFTPDPQQPNRMRAQFQATLNGQHRVSSGSSLLSFEVDPARGETDPLPVNRAALARITQATGGRLVDPADMTTWPHAQPTEKHSALETRALDLTGNLTLLIVLCATLATDWLIRLLKAYT